LPDIVLEIRGAERKGARIHVEIQTGHDGMMDLRMVRYGYLIGVGTSNKDSDDIRVITIPHQVVVYLEENNRIGAELIVKIIFPNESEVNYTVPIFKLFEYSIQELKEKDLYLLLPLVLVKYRKRFERICKRAHKNQEELNEIVQEIVGEIESITKISGDYEEKGKINERTKDIILSATMEMYTQLHQKYIRDKDSKEKVENMIESVTQKMFQKGHMIGIEEGKQEGKQEGKLEGKLEGKQEGIAEGVKLVAKNLLMIGTADEVILKATGLTLEELDSIRREGL